jgi:competence protein ComEA
MPSFTLSRQRALLLAVVALLAVLIAPRVLAHRSAAAPQVSARPYTPPRERRTATRAQPSSPLVVVDVAGAVRRPGLYRLPQGSRIADAVARAGGATRRADEALVNLAAPLADGEQVLVPSSVPGAAAAASAVDSGTPSPSAPVDLNSASAEQLDALPGVGPATAQKIVDYRQQHGPYTSVDDLDAIPGIGPAKIANLKGLVIP